MNVTVDIEENRNIRVGDVVVAAKPPDRIEFTAEGTIAMTESLLEEFEGTSMKPIRIDLSVDDSDPIEIDLEAEASLRLGALDVGIETPDADGVPSKGDLPSGTDAIRSTSNDDAEPVDDSPPGTIAFTVEGVVESVPPGTVGSIESGSPTLRSITLGVEKAVRSDGGPDADALLEIRVLGYSIVVRQDGTVEIGTGEGLFDVGVR